MGILTRTARTTSLSALEEFSRFWMPTPDHRNWAHELCADLIAAWVLGPVYLAAFEDHFARAEQNPYQVSTVHPPYAVRVTALLHAARRLEFVEHTRELEGLLHSWESSRWKNQRNNRYRFLAEMDIVDGLIEGTFAFCAELNLRRWSRSRSVAIDATEDVASNQKLGTDLLVSAWRAFSHRGQEGYASWEAEVVEAVVESLRP
jgi:hypothetical protein